MDNMEAAAGRIRAQAASSTPQTEKVLIDDLREALAENEGPTR